MKRGTRKFKKIKTRINKGLKRSRLTKKRRRNVNTKKRRRNMHGGANGLDSSKIMSLQENLRSWTGTKRTWYIDMYNGYYPSNKAVNFYLDNIRKGDENTILFTLKWFPTGIKGGRFIDMKYNLSPAAHISTISDDKNIFETKGINNKTIEEKVNNIFSKKLNEEDKKTIIKSILEIPDKIKELEKIKMVFTNNLDKKPGLFSPVLNTDQITEERNRAKTKFKDIYTNYIGVTFTQVSDNTKIIPTANELLEKLSFKLDYLLNKKKLIGLSLDWDGCCAPYFLKIEKDDREQFRFIENIINKIDEKTSYKASNVLIFVGSNRQSKEIDDFLKQNFTHKKSALDFFNNNIEKLFNQHTRNKYSKNDRTSPHIFKFMKGLISDNPQMFQLDTHDITFKTITNFNDDILTTIKDNKTQLPVTKLLDDTNILSLYGNEIQNPTKVARADGNVKNVSNHPFNFYFNFTDNKTATHYNEINSKYEQDLKMWLNVYHMKKLIDLTTNIPIDIEYIFLDDKDEFLQNLLDNALLERYSPDVAKKFKDKISCIKIDITDRTDPNKFNEIKFTT